QAAFAKWASHLFIDEAHHIKAPTWEYLKERFKERPVLQFTATPFRNDGKLVDGRPIFTYPLRKAQAEDYFRPITFRPVAEFFPQAGDEAIARRAIEQLPTDIGNGLDHLIMARTEDIARADAVLPIYEALGGEFKPLLLHSKQTKAQRT